MPESMPTLEVEHTSVPDGLCKLPPFRPVVTKVLKVLSREDVEIADLTRLIQSDPAFSAEMLQMANSPLHGFVSRICSVPHAVMVLGLERTKSLTMTIAMRAYQNKGPSSPTVRNCWLHSLACGALASEIAPLFRVPKDQAYTCGLVHDVGRLGLMAAYPAGYTELLDTSFETGEEVLNAERQRFTLDHCTAGLWLAKVWGFPPDLWSIAASHHDTSVTSANARVALVHFACLLADALGLASTRCRQLLTLDEIKEGMPREVRERFHATQEELQQYLITRLKSLELY